MLTFGAGVRRDQQGYSITLSSAKRLISRARPSFPLAEVLRLLWKYSRLVSPDRDLRLEYPGLRQHPDYARRGHWVPPERLVGVVEAPDVPDVDLV